ncbi:MAG: DUF4434 domain-containing protein [Flavobacteriaceae bacterium]
MNKKKIKITGTFLDEISHDIPHQNWGANEWSEDFIWMSKADLKRVILIRCGYKNWITYPSEILIKQEKAIRPHWDLVSFFLQCCEKNNFEFYFGLYDSGKYWVIGDYKKEIQLNKKIISEVWHLYGHSKAFKGWYLSQECSHNSGEIIELYHELGSHCKSVSNGLAVLISPYIDGEKNVSQYITNTQKKSSITLDDHFKSWNEIFSGIRSAVDIVAFQDGHVHYDQLYEFIKVNKELADQNKMTSWINSETFDRDMPIKFLPIKWDKLRFKLDTAFKAGIEDAITFEFSHFMSPQSSYLQAGHLYNRYLEYLKE